MSTYFGAVGDLLEVTISRSAKSQSDADGELAWLRERLVSERRDPRCRGKAALEGMQPRALMMQDGPSAPADKENALLGMTGTGSRAKQVGSTL